MARPASEAPIVRASDTDEAAIEAARANANAAGVGNTFRVGYVRDVKSLLRAEPAMPAGFIITNPPYGERLDADPEFYSDMARALRTLPAHSLCILCGSQELQDAFRARPTRWLALFNGPLETRLIVYEARPVAQAATAT